MNLHRAAAAIVIPFAAALQAFGYYTVRSLGWQQGIDGLQLDMVTVSAAMGVASLAGFVGTVGAVVVGSLVGAPVAAALGVLLTAVGAVVQAFSDSEFGFRAGLAVAGFGAGMYRPALVVSALRPFGASKQAARLVLLLVIYAAVNLAVIPTGVVANLAIGRGNTAYVLIFLLGACCSGAAAVMFLALAGTGFAGGTQLQGSLSGRRMVVSTVAVVVGGASYVGWTLGVEFQWTAMREFFGGGSWLFYLNPVVTVAACLVFACAFGAVQLAGGRPPALGVAGLGLIWAALGLIPSVLAEYAAGPVAAGCVVVGAVGEGLIWAGLLAAAAGDIHWRVAMIPAAMTTGSSTLSNSISALFSAYEETFAAPAASSVGVGIAIGGLLLLAAARPLQRWAGEEPDEADGAPSVGLDPYGFSEAATTTAASAVRPEKSP